MAVRAIKPTSLTFTMIPRRVKSTNSHNHVHLAAVLSPIYHLPYAELIASVKHNKPHFHYTRQLKSFIKKMDLSRKDFKSLEKYLAKQVVAATKEPGIAIAMLNGYLQNGTAPNFSVNFQKPMRLNPALPSMKSLSEPIASMKTLQTEEYNYEIGVKKP